MTTETKAGRGTGMPTPRKPEATGVQFDRIPEEIKGYSQWVVWNYDLRERNDGEKQWTKTLRDAWGSNFAKSNEPTTWAPFVRACNQYRTYQRTARNPGGLDGIGFVFTAADPFCGVDLDKCRDPHTGVIEPWAQDIINALNSYTEVSPSGTGVKIILKASVPGERRRTGRIEMYDQLRYFTLTGAHLPGTPAAINEGQEQLAAIYTNLFPPETKPTPAPARCKPVSLSDQQILDRARQARNGDKFSRLWSGDVAGYPSHSEADQALCSMLAFWCGPDTARIDGLFRASGLYRDKWDKRADYRTETLARAINRSEFYDPAKYQPVDTDVPPASATCDAEEACTVPITITAFLSRFDEDYTGTTREHGQKPCRNVILLRNKRDGHAHRWVAVRCGCWSCPHCRIVLRKAWGEQCETTMNNLPTEQAVYIWEGAADDWSKIRMRISRRGGDYFRIQSGDGQIMVLTTADIADARLASRSEASARFLAALSDVSHERRAVSSSRGWKLAQDEAEKTGEWKRVGHRTGASGSQIMAETLESGGQQVRNIPRKNNLRVEKFIDFRFPGHWAAEEIEAACLRLLRKLSPLNRRYAMTG